MLFRSSATNEPVKNAPRNGWYHPTTQEDRLIGAVMASNNAARLMQFGTDGEGKCNWAASGTLNICGLALASSMNPDGTWQTPDDAESSAYLPVCAKQAWLTLYNYDTDAGVALSLGTYEQTLVSNSSFWQKYCCDSWNRAMQSYWVVLGPSRNVRILGQDDDNNGLCLTIQGYAIER